MKEIERIQDQLVRVFDGDAWYGPTFKDALSGITAEQAAKHSLKNKHSIWEIVLHIIAWQRAVCVRLEEGIIALPPEGDWPSVEDDSERAWQETLAEAEKVYNRLQKNLVQLTDARLDEKLGEERNKPTGGGVSVYVTLHGVIQHTVYHTGQISLLKTS